MRLDHLAPRIATWSPEVERWGTEDGNRFDEYSKDDRNRAQFALSPGTHACRVFGHRSPSSPRHRGWHGGTGLRHTTEAWRRESAVDHPTTWTSWSRSVPSSSSPKTSTHWAQRHESWMTRPMSNELLRWTCADSSGHELPAMAYRSKQLLAGSAGASRRGLRQGAP